QPRVMLRLWETPTLRDLGVVGVDGPGDLRGYAFSPDGRAVAQVRLAVTAPLVVTDLRSGREEAHVAAPACGFAAVAYSPDGRLLLTQDNQGVVRVWERVRRD